jgi:hypothetical protein
MTRFFSVLVLLGLGMTALADNKKPVAPPPLLPKVGDDLGAQLPTWPKVDYLYDAPSQTDMAGKVVIYWFCTPKLPACVDDLARIVTLRDNGRAYIVGFINTTNKKEAQKLDPIRESEGVGRGTLAFGKNVAGLMKAFGIAGSASIIVDIDGKVAMVADAPDLDARDAKVNALIGNIHEYTTSSDGPTTVKAGDKFQLSMTVKLAGWLKYSPSSTMEFKLLSPPADVKCDTTSLRGDQLKIEGNKLTATVTCTAPKASYELRGEIRFGYDAPGGAGLGNDGAKWKFDVKP